MANLLGTSDQGNFVMHQLHGAISEQWSQTFLRASKTMYTMAGSKAFANVSCAGTACSTAAVEHTY